MLNDYDGVQYDYTKKQGLVWRKVFLPPMAPHEWSDREKLWNAVEENEKTKDSRLAREFVVALPVELKREDWIMLLADFIRRQFVVEGMCADAAIHDTDGHNPHAHIMLTVRPLNPDGTWQHKTEKEYLCVRDGEERGFTAAEYKDAQRDGWEKQYPYWVSKKKKEYMTPSQAEAKGLERASKYAKSTKFGRQNPISARWNSEEQLVLWREAWADAVNLPLEQKGLDARIDHRSHAERGIEEQPTIHKGVAAQAMEAKGFVFERCELNRQIKADNALLRMIRETVQKLTAAFENSVAGIASALETLREKIIIADYGEQYEGKRLQKLWADIDRWSKLRAEYNDVRKVIRQKKTDLKNLRAEKQGLSPIHVKKHLELASTISGLTEEIEELRSHRKHILARARCKDSKDMKAFVDRLNRTIDDHSAILEHKMALGHEKQAAFRQYEETYERIRPGELAAVEAERDSIREGWRDRVSQAITETYDSIVDDKMFDEARRTADYHLAMNRRVEQHRKKLYELEHPVQIRQRSWIENSR